MCAELDIKNGIKKTEYAVYVYHPTDSANDDMMPWERKYALASRSQACRRARVLYARGDYSKVEVQKRFFDQKQGCEKNQTLRLYQMPEKRKVGWWAAAVALMSICGMFAFGLLYFMTAGAGV